jgi:hypothetical protein
MPTKVGVGFSDITDSKTAGIEVARIAMNEAGIDKCDLALLYFTAKHDAVLLRDSIRSIIGPSAKIFGGNSVGVITKDCLGYEGFQVGLAVMSSDSITVDMFIEKGLPDNEYNVGTALGDQIKNRSYNNDPNMLLMYDSIKEMKSEGLSLNLATPLIEGMGHSLGNWPKTAGVGIMGDMQGNPTCQIFNDQVEQNSALALVLSGNISLDTIIMHGCKPSSNYRTITKTEGNIVLEIDGKSAVDIISELLGPNSDKSWEDYPLFITLGVNKGDKFGDYVEDDYANRLCMAIDKKRGGLVMFENDLKAGSEVQLMRRSIDIEYVGRRSEELLNSIDSRTPFFALYIDCIGRTSVYSSTEKEEAEEVQRVIGSKIPLLGMYSGVEIAKVGKDIQALDWTGVLCVFSE